MPKQSAGLLLYRLVDGEVEVLLAHPGGPYWESKDEGAWTAPKGEYDPAEEQPLEAARREFAEETGVEVDGDASDLGTVKQRGGKVVHLFAVEGDVDVRHCRSNTFEMEWPPRSGLRESFPEIDRSEWFPLSEARVKIREAHLPFLDRLVTLLGE